MWSELGGASVLQPESSDGSAGTCIGYGANDRAEQRRGVYARPQDGGPAERKEVPT